AITHRARHRPDVIEAVGERHAALFADAPEGRLQSADTAVGGWSADGSTSVGAESTEEESRGDRRAGAGAGSAGRAGENPRISGETESGVGIGPADGELVQHQLAQQHRASLAQLAHDSRVTAVAPARIQHATVRR